MKRVERSRESLKYTLDHRHVPVLEVEPGESFTLETEDAASGSYRRPEDAAHLLDAWYLNYSPSMANPVTGPIYVRGVEPGDTLVVQIERLELDSQGVTYWRPGHRPLGDSLRWSELGKPTLVIGHLEKEEVVMEEAVTWEDGKVRRHPLGLRVPQSPFIGTLAVAPEREVETPGLGQGSWGGNLDVRDMRPPTRVLLPCYHQGALLYVGDVHACQGDGELYGTAMEIRSAVTFRCEVIKGKRMPFVRLETEKSLISLACARPLEEAVWRASIQLMEWLTADYGCSQRMAYLLLGVNPDFRINVYQMTPIGRLQYTAGAEIPKYLLPPRGS
ncbi:MAG TPA: acetamidase/formamidase family protein [Terriglobia bacterium]|nr:acetamidase/formamidase family protein [Terriglobia bacterium]